MNKIILGTISALLIFFVSCTKFEDYESKQLASAPTVKIAREAVMDSSVVVSFTSTTTGFLSFALFEGMGNPVPDSSALIQLNVDAMQMGSGELTAANQPVLVEFDGLTQNTIYELFAVAQNSDGVVSKVSDVLLIKTSDAYAPVLSDIDPGISASATQTTDFQVILVFDEPIGSADAGKFSFSYYLEGADAVASSAVVNPDDPYQVIVTQSREAHTGDYVFLSFAEGAVEDLVGNKVGAFDSGVDEEGAPSGLYWRAAKVGWDIDMESFNPTPGSAISDPEFTIEFKTTVVANNKAADGSVRLIVTGKDVTSIYKVPAANVALADDGKTVTITKPFSPTYGESIYLEVDAGTFTDGFGNPCNAIESGMDDINPDDNPVTEIGWLISYGYTIDMVIGAYDVDGKTAVGDYGFPDEPFSVEITEDPDVENGVLITGLYFSDVAIPAIFNGDFATITITIPVADDGYSWIELGDLYGDGASNSLEIYDGGDGATILININADGSLYTTDDIWWGSYYYLDDANKGWNNIFGATQWTKAASAETSLQKNAIVKTRSSILTRHLK